MMHHYLVIHTIEQYPETQDEWLDLWGNVLRNICGNARWLNSYYDPTKDQLYCLWEAGSEREIEACYTEEGRTMAPITEIREVAYFDIQALSTSME